MRKKNLFFYSFLTLLTFFSFPLSAQEKEYIVISTSPGFYSSDQLISFKTPSDNIKLYYFFKRNINKTLVRYTSPFILSALQHEERKYIIHVKAFKREELVEQKEFTFIIDKSNPPEPETSYPSGMYPEKLEILFNQSGINQIVYAVNSPIDKTGKKWTGKPIILSSDKKVKSDFVLSAYTVDNAGNKSSLKIWNYTVSGEDSEYSKLDVLSPVPGTFVNLQLLYIDHSGYKWIKYTLNKEDPVIHGLYYKKPVEIRKYGSVVLKIAALPEHSEKIELKEIHYTVLPDSIFKEPALINGIYSDSVTIALNNPGYKYTFQEREPDLSDPFYSKPIKLNSIRNGIIAYHIRFKNTKNNSFLKYEYRYLYIIDNRTPATPVISTSVLPPVSDSTLIEIKGSDFSTIYYTLNGSTPDKNASLYKKPFKLKIPQNSKTGSLIVKAAAYAPNGRTSAEVSKLITYDTEPPLAPIVKIIKTKALDIDIQIEPQYGSKTIYEFTLDNSTPVLPGITSPSCNSKLLLSSPYGSEIIYSIVFANIDEAGNISEFSDLYKFTIDKLPPSEPLIFLDNDILTLTGEGEIYYSILEKNSKQPIEAVLYNEPVIFSGYPDKLISYKISAFSVDENGNHSATVDSTVLIDNRTPIKPELYGIENYGIYNSEEITLYIDTNNHLSKVFYTISSDCTDPGMPDINAAQAKDKIIFTGIKDQETSFHIRLVSILGHTAKISEPLNLVFTIDLKKPEIPVLTGFSNRGIYNHEVEITSPSTKTDTCFLNISYGEEIPCDPFKDGGQILLSSLKFDVDNGEEKKYNIQIGAKDRAGNIVTNSNIYSFTIDRKNPALPEISGLPSSGITNQPVEIIFIENGSIYYYEITDDGSIPPYPTEMSKRYENPFILDGYADSAKTYRLSVISVDRAGNTSEQPAVYTFIIDKIKPQVPSAPLMETIKNQRKIIFSWEDSPELTIYYKIKGYHSIFKKYKAPFELEFPLKTNTFVIEYYNKDKAGNNSKTVSREFKIPFTPSSVLVTGIPDNTLINKGITLYNAAGRKTLRYEITTDGTSPAQVNIFSPTFPKKLNFDLPEGETTNYIIKLKLFHDKNDITGSKEQIIHFTIDKTPPLPPEIDGITDNTYYQDNRLISLSSEEGNIFYSVITLYKEKDSAEIYSSYSKPFSLISKEGSFIPYTIYAYAVDKAGNKSTAVKCSVYIDKEIIYVSETGNDYYDGTRTNPFKTLKKAIDYSEITGRTTIYLSGGSFALNSTISLNNNLKISGGFTPETWNNDVNNKTILTKSKYLPSGSSLFTIKNGSIVFENLKFIYDDIHKGMLLFVSGGELKVQNCLFSLSNAAYSTAVYQNNGYISLFDTSINCENVTSSILIDSEGGELSINKCTLKGVNTTDDITLLSFKGTSIANITDCSFLPGESKRAAAINAYKTNIVLSDCDISSGSGRISSTAIVSDSSNIISKNNSIHGENNSRISTTIYSSNSNISISESILKAKAELGAVLIQADNNSSIEIKRSSLHGLKTKDFLYLFKLTDSTANILTNHIICEKANDVIGINMLNSRSKWFNNTITFESAHNFTTGFSVSGDSFTSVFNNIIIKKNIDTGSSAFVFDNISNTELISNNINGWNSFLKTGSTEIFELDKLNTADNNPFGGKISGNISEIFSGTFDLSKNDGFYLKSGSGCINGGFDVKSLGGMDTDWEGEKRPNPDRGIKPQYDIGADEYYK